MAIRLSTGLRNKINDSGLADAFDGGSGRINVYTGSQPAAADNAASGTLLATLTLASDAMGASSGGVLTFNTITSDIDVDASGTAGWFRIYRTGDTAPGSAAGATDRRLDGNITATGGGGDIEFDDIDFVAGGTAAISSLTLTLPASE